MTDDLERHRILRNMTLVGWPLYDDDDNLVGFVDEPEWAIDVLTPEHWAIIGEHTQKCMALTSRPSYGEARAFVLADYGIACAHEWTAKGTQPWTECRWCGLSKERPGRPVTVEGVGDMWATDPPHLVLRIPRPVALSAATEAVDLASLPDQSWDDEYRWTGSRYRLVEVAQAEAAGASSATTADEANPGLREGREP